MCTFDISYFWKKYAYTLFPLSPSFTFISTDRFKFNRLKTYEVHDGINLLYTVDEKKK